MKIYEVTDKKKYMPLLLLADEQENMIDRYIDTGKMYILEDDAIIGEIVVCEISGEVMEIKNLAVFPEYQHKGYGKALIEFICEKYKDRYSVLQVGTGNSSLTVPFYEKCGFVKSHIVKNFFVENYYKPIIENGVRLIDMVYLRKTITKENT